MEILSECAQTTAAPDGLAAHYKMDAFADAHFLMEHLSRNRAAACADALVG